MLAWAESRPTILAREGLLGVAERAVLRDLGQHRRQAGDAGVQRVAVLGRRQLPARPADTVAGSHGPSSSRTWLSTHDQAASPSSRYASLATTRTGYGVPSY